MNRITTRIFFALAAISAIGAHGAPGEIDPAFAASNVAECSRGLLASSDAGAIYVSCLGVSGELLVIKFRANGSRDSRWGNAGVARQVFGGLGAPGYAGVGSQGGFRVVFAEGRVLHFLSDGSQDTQFGIANSALLFDGTTQNISLQTLPDGSMVTLNYRSVGYPAVTSYVVRKLPPNGSATFPIPEFVYPLPESLRNEHVTYVIPLAWSLQADDTLELLLPDYYTGGGGWTPMRNLHVYRIQPDSAAVETDRTFPARGIANVTHRNFRVFGDGSKLFGSYQMAKWSADNRLDQLFFGQDAARLQPWYLYCNFAPAMDTVSMLANGRFVAYYKQAIYHGLGRGTSCDDLISSPRFADGYANPSMPSAFSSVGQGEAYSSFIAQDGGIVTLRYSDMRLQRFQGHGPRADVAVVEYYHAGLDHYFITATPNEIDDLDNAPSSGWKRTGHRFGAWNIDTPMPNTETVCRYYGDLTAGPNSHFYSAEKFECDILAQQEAASPIGRRAWRFERNGFRITVPVAGKCNEALVPVRRVYNNAGPGKDPNHRYLTSDSEFQAMRAKGWVDEGVHMCATPNLGNFY